MLEGVMRVAGEFSGRVQSIPLHWLALPATEGDMNAACT